MPIEGVSPANTNFQHPLGQEIIGLNTFLAEADSKSAIKKPENNAEVKDKEIRKRQGKRRDQEQKEENREEQDLQDEDIVELSTEQDSINDFSHPEDIVNNLSEEDYANIIQKVDIQLFSKEHYKNYDIKYNTESGMVDIINVQTKSAIQSITLESLTNIINKLDYNGGVFIDKRV